MITTLGHEICNYHFTSFRSNTKMSTIYTSKVQKISKVGHDLNESRQSSNTMKAYANGSISRQYFFDTKYFHLLLGLRSFQKSPFLKLTILFCQYFWCQIWDQWHKLSGKNTHIFFFYFLFKNKRVWAKKIGKKRKNSKNLKVAGTYPNI